MFDGDQLRKLRKERFLSQEALGKRSGVHSTAISHLESGHRQPRWSTIEKLHKRLRINAETGEIVSMKDKQFELGTIEPTENLQAPIT